MSTSVENIFHEIQVLKKQVAMLKEKKYAENFEELSLNKVRRLLKRGYNFIKNEADQGRLRAIIGEDENGKRSYHFTLADIMEWQNKRKENSKKNYVDVIHVNPHFAKDYVKNFHKNKAIKKEGAA